MLIEGVVQAGRADSFSRAREQGARVHQTSKLVIFASIVDDKIS
jgi:hypothetical protein